MTTTNHDPVLALEHAQKSFGAVHALEDGDIDLFAGEVHGLVGENGAGKSTLVKILAGVHRPDAGRLVLDGEEAIFDNAKQSQDAGIAIIFQEPTLFPDLSVAENIFVGVQPLKRFRRIDGRRMRREAAAVFEQLGVSDRTPTPRATKRTPGYICSPSSGTVSLANGTTSPMVQPLRMSFSSRPLEQRALLYAMRLIASASRG